MELAEIIEAVKAVDKDEFTKALQEGSQGHYQHIFNAGHKTATAANKTKLEEQSGRISELEALVSGKDDELKELASKKPDLEKLKTEYESKLLKAQEEKKTLESEWKEKFNKKEHDRLRAELVAKVQGHYADPWAAEKAVDKAVMDRVHINDEGYKVYQLDGVTPYAPADGQNALDLYAAEIVGTIPAALINPPKNNGSNYKGGSGEKKSSTLKRSEATRSERIAFINEHGLAAWNALPMK